MFINKVEIDGLESLISNGKITIKPFSFFKQFTREQLLYFMWKYGIYCLPNKELIDLIEPLTHGKTIEIGAGNGSIARALRVVATDSKLQESSIVKKIYGKLNQPRIFYPDDIVKMDAVEAINHYKPDTVFGSFITHEYFPHKHHLGGNNYGVDEEFVLAKVGTYINIGSSITHKNKPILKHNHVEIQDECIIVRNIEEGTGRIWVWTK